MTGSETTRRIIAWLSIGALIAALVLGACTGEEDEQSGGFGDNITPGPSENDSSQDNDEEENDQEDEQEDTSCEDVSCDDGEVCVEGECIHQTRAGYSCAEPFDLGTLGDGVTVTETADPRGEENVMTTLCSHDDESPQAVFRFDVDAPMAINIDAEHTASMNPIVTELRTDSCQQLPDDDMCEDWQLVEPDRDHYVIVEALQGNLIAEFELTLSAEEAACAPHGATSCQDGHRVSCSMGAAEETLECLDGCDDAECIGADCSNPIEINGSTTLVGEVYGHRNSLDLDEDASCALDIGSTTGQDVVFSMPDLHAGQVLEVIPPGNGNWVVAVVDDCDMSAEVLECVDGGIDYADFSWQVEQDGDYYVVVTRLSVDDPNDIQDLESSSGAEDEFVFEITD